MQTDLFGTIQVNRNNLTYSQKCIEHTLKVTGGRPISDILRAIKYAGYPLYLDGHIELFNWRVNLYFKMIPYEKANKVLYNILKSRLEEEINKRIKLSFEPVNTYEVFAINI